jgi:hypothetical protein
VNVLLVEDALRIARASAAKHGDVRGSIAWRVSIAASI